MKKFKFIKLIKSLQMYLLLLLLFFSIVFSTTDNNSNNNLNVKELQKKANTIQNIYYFLLGFVGILIIITLMMIFSRFEFKQIKPFLISLILICLYIYYFFIK